MTETAAERTYTLSDAAALLGVSESRVRKLVDRGLLPVRGRAEGRAFTFRDLVLLRSAQGLADRKVSPRRIRTALRRLGGQLSPGRPASSVVLDTEGRQLVARDGTASWDPETGQGVLELGSGSARWGTVHALRSAPTPDVDVLFQQALALEPVDAGGAAALYGRVLEACPSHGDAHVNLGRLHHGAGRLSAAEAHYRAALAAQPSDAIAAFNLAVALDDQGRSGDALAAYHQALGLEPALADAHYNLARLHERRGERVLALRHLKEYRRLAS
ncbi:MAG TPA: tetratricopeptide repeat protein [Myxococcaceae bacterium]|nr:tetratricopeptide repeat protein [Myxococcaceae bacterium]